MCCTEKEGLCNSGPFCIDYAFRLVHDQHTNKGDILHLLPWSRYYPKWQLRRLKTEGLLAQISQIGQPFPIVHKYPTPLACYNLTDFDPKHHQMHKSDHLCMFCLDPMVLAQSKLVCQNQHCSLHYDCI
jgi:hypothetical protein